MYSILRSLNLNTKSKLVISSMSDSKSKPIKIPASGRKYSIIRYASITPGSLDSAGKSPNSILSFIRNSNSPAGPLYDVTGMFSSLSLEDPPSKTKGTSDV